LKFKNKKMKKKIVLVSCICFIACGVIILNNNHTDKTSNLSFSNLEALAEDESQGDCPGVQTMSEYTITWEEVICLGKSGGDNVDTYEDHTVECTGTGHVPCCPSFEVKQTGSTVSKCSHWS
jgi:hypothetical protein